MLSHLARFSTTVVGAASKNLLSHHPSHSTTTLARTFSRSTTVLVARSFSSSSLTSNTSNNNINDNDPQASFVAKPPAKLNEDIARGIQHGNQLILRHGVGYQRLQLLSTQSDLPLVRKWQRMMEIYLGAQLHVIAALGYETNEQGIMMYTQQLAHFVQGCDVETQDEFRAMGRDTWRHMLATTFSLNVSDLQEEMSIVDARNTVHKVASRLMEPSILELVAQRCAQLPPRKYP